MPPRRGATDRAQPEPLPILGRVDDQVLPDPAAVELTEGGSIETSAHGRKLALSTLIFAAATAISRVVA